MVWNKAELTGKTFERLTVIKEDGRNKHSHVMWLCKCECGNETRASTNSLNRGKTRSCGCLQRDVVTERSRAKLLGKRFGMLEVIKFVGINVESKRSKRAKWLCKCDCGGTVIAQSEALLGGYRKSCGCIQREGARERMTGENHPNFNPDLTKEERLKHRYTLDANQKTYKLRKKTFERDDYTCQICSARNGNGKRIVLNAHHIDGWNWCKEKRFDLDNMITLCDDCHSDFHSRYGGGDNTKEQFEEYRKQVLVHG